MTDRPSKFVKGDNISGNGTESLPSFDDDLARYFTGETSDQVKNVLLDLQLPLPESKLEYLRGTDGIILFDTPHGIVIRIEKEQGYRNSARADSRWMIQPIGSIKTATGEASVEIIPGVHFEEKDAESRKLFWKMAADGYEFWDERLDNVGRLPLKNVLFPAGVPIVIDRLAARPLDTTLMIERALLLSVFPNALEPRRSPLYKEDLHFWDILAEHRQMISEAARKAVAYVIPKSLVPPTPDPQEVLYGDLKTAFRVAWPEGAAHPTPHKMQEFWNKTSEAKAEGRLVAGWNENRYTGNLYKPKAAATLAATYEKRLKASSPFSSMEKQGSLQTPLSEKFSGRARKAEFRSNIEKTDDLTAAGTQKNEHANRNRPRQRELKPPIAVR